MGVGHEGVHRGGSGEPLVLIHGFSGTRQLWDPVLVALERDHDVLAVGLAGHVGGPVLTQGVELSVASLVDAVERDMQEAGFESAHIVGNSLGGWIALELAARGRARSVVGLSPAGGWEVGSRAERRLRGLFTRNHKLSKALLPRMESLMRRPRLRRALLRQVVARGERVPAAAAAQLVRDSVECPVYFELMEAILRDGPPPSFDGVVCPVLIAWGTRDRILPSRSYAARLRELVPAAEWVELRGLGHVPMSDDAELVARTISDFTARAREHTPVVA
ncbi:MAG TPA: alpha/beta hydrolase [Solirubrobacteraceae bacterium]|jgi:pimeloyl-ACP methyl ester carboxylesterase|nr:alpha/beta hydrolase [Solirubrobacteraceae bacterium]